MFIHINIDLIELTLFILITVPGFPEIVISGKN